MADPRPVLWCMLVLALVVGGGTAFARTIKVPSGKPTIQAAIDAAANGDVVVVAKGTYRENIDFRGKAITVRGTKPTDRAVVAATIIDGGQKGSVVTFRSGERATSALKGFTITNGNTSSMGVGVGNRLRPEAGLGGGVSCSNHSSPTIEDNTISGNRAGKSGGGVCCSDQSSPALTSNVIVGNAADYGGGVECEYQSSPTLTSNTISRNKASGRGGGVSCYVDSSPALIHNTISGNRAEHGGGVDCEERSSPALTHNTISGNRAGWGGGGLGCCGHSSPTVTNDTISNNSADRGGGVFCDFDSSPSLKSTVVALSTSGGGLYVYVTDESSYLPSRPVITHCDFYGNVGGDYVNWPDQTGTGGNISQDPLFADAARGDFHLRSRGGRWDPVTRTWVVDSVHSPCIDAGDPRSPFANEPMPNGGRIDIGAYGNTEEASKSVSAGGGR